MRRALIVVFFTVSVMMGGGTPAGTVIQNVATLDFVVDQKHEQIKSNVATDIVAQLIDLHIDALDSAPPEIQPGQTTPPLAFKITNTGNGSDTFVLEVYPAEKNDFSLENPQIYIDSNQNGKYDPQDKKAEKIALDMDIGALFFIVARAPDRIEVQKRKSLAGVAVKGSSVRGGSGIRGKVHIGKGVDSVDAVDGEKGGVDKAEAFWRYLSDKKLYIRQHSYIQDPFGHHEPITGATITYEINITAPEGVTVKNARFRNPIPAHTLYQKGSLRHNSKPLTDRKDRDEGYFDAKNNLIKVDLGCISAMQTERIRFKVKIK